MRRDFLDVSCPYCGAQPNELELLRVLCAGCGHPLAVHSRVAAACSGFFGGSYCDCKGFQDTTDEQLALA